MNAVRGASAPPESKKEAIQMKLVLASQSPRRRELLSIIQPDFIVQASHVEEIIPDGLDARQAVMHLAKIKAEW